jgi:hypothetical protein
VPQDRHRLHNVDAAGVDEARQLPVLFVFCWRFDVLLAFCLIVFVCLSGEYAVLAEMGMWGP